MRAFVLSLAILIGSCGSCPDETGTRYECNCSATCNGEPVTSYSTPCADDSSEATDLAEQACGSELSLCPGVTCSCSCASSGDSCPIRQCRAGD